MDENASFTVNDVVFLEYYQKHNFTFDPETGIIRNTKGKEIGHKGKRAVTISIYKNGVAHGVARARAIWLLTNGAIPKGYGVGHISTNLCDDSIGNLELSTNSSRSKKALEINGNKMRENAFSKLTIDMVNEARRLAHDPRISYNFLANKYGVTRQSILAAIKGVSWKEASEPPVAIRKGRWMLPEDRKARVKKPREKKEKIIKPKIIKPKVVKVKIVDDATRIARSLLRNNLKLSNRGILKFLRMRRVNVPITERKLKRIRQEIRMS